MNKDSSLQSQKSCATCSTPSQTCQNSLGHRALMASAEPTANRVWQARMGNEVTLDHAERRGKTDEMEQTEKRVLQVMKALSAQCPSISGEGPSFASSRPKRSGVRGLICAARAAVVSAWLALVGTSTPARCLAPQIRPRRLRSSSNKTEFGSELHGHSSSVGSEQHQRQRA